ncbi:CMP-N,N'-diacetyllegionaminic acid synthase [compost metagenome]
MLLQPTSPFRDEAHLKQMIQMKENDPKVDMIVSVKESKDNPYFNLFEEQEGRLHKSKQGDFLRRQDCPKVYAYNGSIYLFNRSSLEAKQFHEFENVAKFVMEEEMYNLDIDTPKDWRLAEYLLSH